MKNRMSSWAYYNEIDPYCVEWLKSLIAEGLIADGIVDSRSILDVTADDVSSFTQCHFFAGIGGWSVALRMAGWEDDRPVWTGSPPCQPFSIANVAHGGGKGNEDERHLLPVFGDLIAKCGADTIFGEQVADAIAKGWLDELCSILENSSYACGAIVLPAFAVGTSHERKRLYWVADSCRPRWPRYQPVRRISKPASSAFSIYGHPLVDARRALEGDYGDLLPCDGLSIQMERCATRGYGNAVVPQVAAQFIKAYR